MKTKTKRTATAKLLTNVPKTRLSYDDVAFAAYCLWEHKGRPQGRDWNHWFRAEDLLREATHRAHVLN